jgi:hypothetical protein
MKSTEQRKLTLISQIHQLKRELENLKRQDYTESQLRTCTEHSGYTGLGGFDCRR